MGVKSSSELSLFLLLTAELCLGAEIKISVYIPDLRLNLTDAKLYCQRNHTDLITWNIVEILQLTSWMETLDLEMVWISHQSDAKEKPTGNLLNTIVSGNQASEDNGNCFIFKPAADNWYTTTCSANHRFVCYKDNLVVVNENKTWEDSLEHCRKMTTQTHKYDLLSLPDVLDYDYVRERINDATTDEVWKALRFMGGEWFWLNGGTVDHRNMLPDCPTRWQHCGTVSKYDTNNWITRDCSERRNYICYYEETAP